MNNGGKYSGAATSKWNGMDAKAWEAEMKKQGYVRFADDGTNFRAGIDPAISKYLKVQPGDLLHPPKDLSGVSKDQLQAHIDALLDRISTKNALLSAWLRGEGDEIATRRSLSVSP